MFKISAIDTNVNKNESGSQYSIDHAMLHDSTQFH